MKVLIITYYWVPAGGSGVQRWLKFVKYLRDFHIEPVVFTVDSPNYPIVDTSLENEVPEGVEVLREGIWEPNDFFSIFKKNETKTSSGFLNPNPSLFGKLLQYIRANYFIPDARKFWIKRSIKRLEKYLDKTNMDVIITTGPPHSVHLIGLGLKKKFKQIKWISDFRDPWTAIDYFHQLPLSKKSIEQHHALEKEVLETSDAVLVVGKTMKNNYLKYTSKIHVIPNGFDENLRKVKTVLDQSFSITHIGLMNSDRNAECLWKALKELSDENPNFARDLNVKLIGKVDEVVKKSLNYYIPEECTEIIDYLPHAEVKAYQRKSQVLLLSINNVPSAKGILTGKVFEYLQAKRPILAIGPEDGDLAEILRLTNAGHTVDFNDKDKIKEVVLSYYKLYKTHNLNSASYGIEQFHRKTLTKTLSTVIKEIHKV